MKATRMLAAFGKAGKRIHLVGNLKAGVIVALDMEGRLLMYFAQSGASTQGEAILPAAVKLDYDNLGYFQKFVAPGRQIDYLIFVISQFGSQKVSVYGFLKQPPS